MSEKVFKALGRSRRGSKRTEMPAFLDAKNLITFISSELSS